MQAIHQRYRFLRKRFPSFVKGVFFFVPNASRSHTQGLGQAGDDWRVVADDLRYAIKQYEQKSKS